MSIALLLVGSALATEPAEPTSTIGISLEPPEEQMRFRERRAAAGADQPATQMACRPFMEALSLCFTWQADDGRRYVTQAELGAWSVSLEELELAATARASASLGPTRPERTAVVDLDKTYWLSMDGDGLDMAGFLAPAALEAACGENLRVAAPARDIFVAWNGGDDELDAILAIGVARIHEASDHPVTAKVFALDPTTATWAVWGQARR